MFINYLCEYSNLSRIDPSMADLSLPHSMGNTVIGVTYCGGVVLSADSCTSTGMYVANRASDKMITQLADNVKLCGSGSAADSLKCFRLCALPSPKPWAAVYVEGRHDQRRCREIRGEAVSLAIGRDSAGGGIVQTVILNSEGVTRNLYHGDSLPPRREELEPQDSLLAIYCHPHAVAPEFKFSSDKIMQEIFVRNKKSNGRRERISITNLFLIDFFSGIPQCIEIQTWP
ncbi:hypothetical protein RHMOL_Rhmol08G0015600 [Rhododendron molle]|uniref:Uncharacterized protein n=1 Tax=Rhododendron molle TaxID=49168 RepID=A0ACC0MJT6_RHOML|nr:hypothetical protein RHMOL_Rhmol08G0015600 [Rhododendron molle]